MRLFMNLFMKGKTEMKKTVAVLLIACMALALASCAGNGSDVTTAAGATTVAAATTTGPIRTKAPPSSIELPWTSEFPVEKLDPFAVNVGTTYEEVIAQLPTKLYVEKKVENNDVSKELFSERFLSDISMKEAWDYCDIDEKSSVDGKIVFAGGSNKFMGAVKASDWSSSEGMIYANYAVKAKFTTVHGESSGNYGLIFRAVDVKGDGPDGYHGMYIGITEPGYDSENVGKTTIFVGKSVHGKYADCGKTTTIEHATDTPYEIELIVYNSRFLLYIDGQKIYDEPVDIDSSMRVGSAGFRAFNQSMEMSEFSVRSLGAEDYEKFGGYVELTEHEVEWSCPDYNPEKKRRYAFFGKIKDMEGTMTSVVVTVEKQTKK